MGISLKRIIAEYKEAFSLFSRNIKYFLLGNVMLGIASNMVQLLLNLYMKSLGFSGASIGQVLSYRALGSFLISLPASILVARLEPKLILIGTALLLGASYTAQSIFSSFGAIAAAVFFTGVFNSVYQVAAGPFFMRNSGEKERTHIFALNGALGMGTGVIGSLFGGIIKDIIFENTHNEPYAYAMTLLTSVCFIIAAIIPFTKISKQGAHLSKKRFLFFKKQSATAKGTPAVTVSVTAHEIPVATRTIANNPSKTQAAASKITNNSTILLYVKILIPGFIVGMGAGLTIPYLNLYFKNTFSLSDSVIAVIFSMGQVITFIGMMSGPIIARRIGKERTIFFTQIISIPFILVLTYLHFIPAVIIAFLIRQGLMNMSSPINDNFALEMVPHEQQHLMNALKMLNWTGSWMVSARISGNMIDNYGFAPSFTLTAVLYAVSSGLFWLFFLKKKPAVVLST